jgi:hypothetical protein
MLPLSRTGFPFLSVRLTLKISGGQKPNAFARQQQPRPLNLDVRHFVLQD